MIITATSFTLKSWHLYFKFFVYTYRVVRQVRSSGGIVKMKIKPLSLKTITAWKTNDDMVSFRNTGAHLDAMKKSSSFGSIQSVTWEAESVPTWEAAICKLRE